MQLVLLDFACYLLIWKGHIFETGSVSAAYLLSWIPNDVYTGIRETFLGGGYKHTGMSRYSPHYFTLGWKQISFWNTVFCSEY